MDKVVMPHVVGHENVVIVPDVVENSVEDADHLLMESDLLLVKEAEVFDPVVPEGYIISQKPRAYSKVKKGRSVRVVVSRGSEQLTVPNLTRGISLRQAEIELKSSGFELGYVSYQFSDEAHKGVVISQSPPPNGTAPRGSLINLTISSGSMTGVTVVPELIGLSLESALAQAAESGLTVGVIEYVDQEDLLPETVVGQSLESGQEVARGTAIDVTVSQ
ncbi:MAG: PASTA domain-containing protein [Gemmatimonadota bacterium]|nr:MAG: PASTA domain-containing protein [Gemmatimonadota bacterium]